MTQVTVAKLEVYLLTGQVTLFPMSLPSEKNLIYNQIRESSQRKEERKKNSCNLCLAVWTALGFHDNTFSFVFDQKCRDDTRALDNHLTEEAHMDDTCLHKSKAA